MRTPKVLKSLFVVMGLAMLAFTIVSFFAGIFDPVSSGLVLGNFALASIQDTDMSAWEMQDGEENMGGFGQVVYLGLRSQITAYPTLPSETATSFEDLVTLGGDFTFSTGKHFIKILVAPESMQYNPESQGEYPGAKSFSLKGSFIIPGMRADQRAIARILNNSYGILIIPQEDGTRICLGTETRPVHFSPKGKSGQKAADTKVFEFEFTTDSHVPGYNYNGTIPLDGVTLPAIS